MAATVEERSRVRVRIQHAAVPARVDGVLLPADQLALVRLAPGEMWLVLLLSPHSPFYARLAACAESEPTRLAVEPLSSHVDGERAPLRCMAEVSEIGRAEPGQVWARLTGDEAALVAQRLAPGMHA